MWFQRLFQLPDTAALHSEGPEFESQNNHNQIHTQGISPFWDHFFQCFGGKDWNDMEKNVMINWWNWPQRHCFCFHRSRVRHGCLINNMLCNQQWVLHTTEHIPHPAVTVYLKKNDFSFYFMYLFYGPQCFLFFLRNIFQTHNLTFKILQVSFLLLKVECWTRWIVWDLRVFFFLF